MHTLMAILTATQNAGYDCDGNYINFGMTP